MKKQIKITVLTATLNVEHCVSGLINSLHLQTDKDFEWLVIDGYSSDNTIKMIEDIDGLNIKIIISNDFGIYDALNKGVNSIETGFYIVVGADDVLSSNCISDYRAALNESDADIVTASVIQNSKIIPPRKDLGWLYGLPGIAGSHAVGMLINVNLHKKFGLYSRKFPIAADQLFVKKALAGGAIILRKKFIAGEFSNDGTSGSDPIGLLTDVFRVQLLTERFVLIQYILFIIRLLKLYAWVLMGLTKFNFKKLF